ncbi:hypothetical protein LOAG_07101 [Loa loa]|uniref:Uncharacterized protein n=1 Tax=Loa loa TaxID=7209 RepID=A0A1S0TWI1_LOALO|nr:hypothetical protein LOAG_07101 [Loa loa]EFO21384.1 hypothetical protein LOAG_07101 [Loa loa]
MAAMKKKVYRNKDSSKKLIYIIAMPFVAPPICGWQGSSGGKGIFSLCHFLSTNLSGTNTRDDILILTFKATIDLVQQMNDFKLSECHRYQMTCNGFSSKYTKVVTCRS